MKTIYVNERWGGDKEVARGFILIPKTVDEAIKTLFPEPVQKLLPELMKAEKTKKEKGFHFIMRFCQFVVVFNYNDEDIFINGRKHKLGVSIELLFFGTSDNINDTFDYMLKLKHAGWDEGDRENIIRIASEIKSDMDKSHFEVADMIVKDPLNSFSSYYN